MSEHLPSRWADLVYCCKCREVWPCPASREKRDALAAANAQNAALSSIVQRIRRDLTLTSDDDVAAEVNRLVLAYDALTAQNAALVAALEVLRWSSHDGGCFDPAAKLAREWFRWEPCLPGNHNDKCLSARALLAQQPGPEAP